jgi:spore germination protein KC
MRRNALLLLTLWGAFLLAGCWDRSEPEEIALATAVAVDRLTPTLYDVTFMMALPGQAGDQGGASGKASGKPYAVITVQAPTVTGAISLADTVMEREISLRHMKFFFMSEELARAGGLHALDEIVRFRHARRTVFYMVTKGSAADFLKRIHPEPEKDPQRFIEQLTAKHRTTGMIPRSGQIQTFVRKITTGYSDPLTYYLALVDEPKVTEAKATPASGNSIATSPATSGFRAGELPRSGGPNFELLGGAAFRGEKMVGVLTNEEMRTVLMLQDEFRRGHFSIPDPSDPDLHLALEIHRGRPLALSADLSGSRPRLRGTITLEAELQAIQTKIDYTDPERQRTLEQATARLIQNRMQETIKKTQGWGADVAGFGEHVVRYFPTMKAWEDYRWAERYATADIDIDVRVTLRRFGSQLSPPEPQPQKQRR